MSAYDNLIQRVPGEPKHLLLVQSRNNIRYISRADGSYDPFPYAPNVEYANGRRDWRSGSSGTTKYTFLRIITQEFFQVRWEELMSKPDYYKVNMLGADNFIMLEDR